MISAGRQEVRLRRPEATIEGLRFWTDLIKNKQSPDLKTMTDTAPAPAVRVGQDRHVLGRLVERRGVLGNNEYTKDKVDVAPLPKGEKQATIIHGVANVVSAKTEHPEQAWEFVKFLGSKPAADILGKKGPIPAYTGTQDAWVSAPPRVQAARSSSTRSAYAVPYPVSAQHRRLERGGAQLPHQGLDRRGAGRGRPPPNWRRR